MNAPQPPIDWNHVRAFLATAETGSLSAAARQLALTQPTLSRQVAALEAQLGVVLFERIGRALALTESGRELLDHTRAMGQAADRIALSASGRAQAIAGLVRISASDVFSAHYLPGFLHHLRDAAPGLQIDVVATNDITDLQRREADIAIRHVRPTQPELIARLVLETTAHFYAATSYLERRGRPATQSDLAGHDFVGFGDIDAMLAHLLPMGLPLTPENFPVRSNGGIVSWELVRQGFGIAPMADAVALATPEVERVLPDRDLLPPIVFPFWLTTHRELHTSRKIRLVFDMLAEYLVTHD